MYNQDPFLANYQAEYQKVQQAYNNELQRLNQELNNYRTQQMPNQYGQFGQQQITQPVTPQQTIAQQPIPQQPVQPLQPDTTNVQMLGALGEIKVLLERMNKNFVEFKDILDPPTEKKSKRKGGDDEAS